MISAEKEEKKKKYLYLICDTNLTLTNMYDESMYVVFGLYFTFNSFFHIEQKNIKNMLYLHLKHHTKLLTFS